MAWEKIKMAFSIRKTPRWDKYDYNFGVYFITICTKGRRCLLSRIVGTGVLDCPKTELTECGKIAEKYINQFDDFYNDIEIKSYVIMPNHIHILLYIKENSEDVKTNSIKVERANSSYSKFISTFKRFFNKEYGENIWQSRSYDHIIRNRDDYEEHLRYIYENPMRWYYDEMYSEE